MFKNLSLTVKFSLVFGLAASTNLCLAWFASSRVGPIAYAFAALGIFVSALATFSLLRYIKQVVGEFQKRMDSMKNYCIAGLRASAEALAGGDLTHTISPATTKIEFQSGDEFGDLVSSFNIMLGDLHASVYAYTDSQYKLSAILELVRDQAQLLSGTVGQLTSATEQSGTAANEIAGGSEKLAQSASEAANEVDQLLSIIQGVSSGSSLQVSGMDEAGADLRASIGGIERVAHASQQMAETANEGNAAVQKTIEAMNTVTQQVAHATTQVQELNLKGERIGEIVKTIEDIAEKTNLLALNAAIEAARAGEHGRGFAVVADEVRKLAEQASRATGDISTLIQSVRQDVEVTVEAIQKTNQNVQEGRALSTQAGDALDHIVQAAQKVTDESSEVASLARRTDASMQIVRAQANGNLEAAVRMEENANSFSQNIVSVAAISQESAAGAEELSATVQEVAAASQQMNAMAEELKEALSQFKTLKADQRSEKSQTAFLKVA